MISFFTFISRKNCWFRLLPEFTTHYAYSNFYRYLVFFFDSFSFSLLASYYSTKHKIVYLILSINSVDNMAQIYNIKHQWVLAYHFNVTSLRGYYCLFNIILIAFYIPRITQIQIVPFIKVEKIRDDNKV